MWSTSRLNGKLQAMIEKEGNDLGEEDGFVNLGSINSDLEALQSSFGRESLEQMTGPELAGSMLVFMAHLLHRPSFTFPVAQYATCSLSGAKLYLWFGMYLKH